MDPDDAVLLTDVVPTGYQAAEMGGIRPGDTVVVFGAGPVGIMAARCAWLFGTGHRDRLRGLPSRVRENLCTVRGPRLQVARRAGGVHQTDHRVLGGRRMYRCRGGRSRR